MTPEQIALVQTTFKSVLPIKETAADLFYTRLFELDPTLKQLFTGDMKEQGQKLMSAIATVVGGLNNWAQVEPTVRELGQRHVSFGVKTQDYQTVGAALLWTLEQGLGDAFNEDVKQAWAAAYGAIADVMTDVAKVKVA